MRLGVNGWRVHGQRTGVGRYLLNLVTRWDRELLAGRFDVTFYSPRAVDRTDVRLPEGMAEKVFQPEARMLVWENVAFGPRADDDVLFCPSYTRPLLARGRTVVTVFDATIRMHPELYGRTAPAYSRIYGWSAHHATLVVTATEAGRQDIARYMGVPLDRIRVTPLAAADYFRRVDDEALVGRVAERFVGSDVPYFLFVGKTTGRRRVPMLMESFAAFKRGTGLPHKLLLVGSRPTPEMDEVMGRLDLVDDVRYSGFVDDDDLNLIFNGAQAMISPAVYESVSLPILEAQATGTPVICVETAGSREMTGGSAAFMPLLDLPSLVGAMTSVAGDEILRRDLRDGGLGHSAQYSWDRTARETLDVLTEAASAPARAVGTPR